MPKSCTGRYANESIFTAAANAAIVTGPKLSTSRCTSRMPKFIADCCAHVNSDMSRMSASTCRSNRSDRISGSSPRQRSAV